MLKIQRIDTRQPDAQTAIDALRAKLAPSGDVVSEAGRRKTMEVFGKPLSPSQVVEQICGEVRSQGLAAVLNYSAKLDGASLTAKTLRVPSDELAAAHKAAAPEFLQTVRRIRENILRFQTAILHRDVEVEMVVRGSPDPAQGATEGLRATTTMGDLRSGGSAASRDPRTTASGDPRTTGGSKLRQRYVPLERVGICVPGGAAAYPSTVLMTAVPAQAAGVKEIAVVSPPTPNGAYNQNVLATCHELGIREVYRIGGAQGVAALAYGLEGLAGGPLKKVDKIVGPGNQFVALAKKYVFGDVDIDSIAGPSEIVLIADETTRADFAAADLIAQAEHAPGSSVLISWSASVLDDVATELEKQLATALRADLARQSLESFGALVLVSGRENAAELANILATEHLHIACAEPEEMLNKIHNAGAVFIGPFSPVALGDYVAGPSHVLPTGATARFASGLSSNDFLRSHSVIQFNQQGLDAVAEDAMRMAEVEGLAAHGASVAIRRASDDGFAASKLAR